MILKAVENLRLVFVPFFLVYFNLSSHHKTQTSDKEVNNCSVRNNSIPSQLSAGLTEHALERDTTVLFMCMFILQRFYKFLWFL